MNTYYLSQLAVRRGPAGGWRPLRDDCGRATEVARDLDHGRHTGAFIAVQQDGSEIAYEPVHQPVTVYPEFVLTSLIVRGARSTRLDLPADPTPGRLWRVAVPYWMAVPFDSLPPGPGEVVYARSALAALAVARLHAVGVTELLRTTGDGVVALAWADADGREL